MNTFDMLERQDKMFALQIFNSLLQNEQQKAIQAVQAFQSEMDFGGTSVTALIRRPTLSAPIHVESLEGIAEIIAREYVLESRSLEPKLQNGFSREEVDLFKQHGVFYGVHISPKLIATCEQLVVDHKDLLIEGFPDPYELPKHPREVIDAYFVELKKQRGLDLELSSLVLADTTTPEGMEGKKILNPTGLNEKLAKLSDITTQKVRDAGVNVDPLYFVSTDTDTPQRVLLSEGKSLLQGFPLTPGLTMCGSTATIDGFDFKYAYRIGLIAQTISNNIISSRMQGSYSPFIFVGMLSPFGYSNGAIPTGKMGDLRYQGNIDLKKEFEYQFGKDVHRLMGGK